ncbi:CDP-alcohol phosphatidyltransferase family protein [Clostridium sp. 'White wine YQ']|uniref:CDP-alcohol phosphatidyltransferase family protein n=1 Tax=Clostridium sp. 'White wine YQ' TaxID=3027474 RepID=UPI002365AC5C|nr:CDP-alcohol phosphatidyltransferase family protein [Clostridium sp. 'White wine YQ']MDD7794492.1 CDP-alcohol phosphatidyltransferase family protein [Clostridium sp. 'White wine YQ']
MTKNIPNMLSSLRIVFSIFLLTLIPHKIIFVAIYIFIGLTDVLDGFIARRYGLESDLGAKLDSFADFVFYLIFLIIFLKEYSSIINFNRVIMLILIIAIRILNLLFTKIKYKEFVFIHTIGNKLSGLIIFLMPIMLIFIKSPILVWTILIIVLISALEELLITIKYKEPDLNRRSILFK